MVIMPTRPKNIRPMSTNWDGTDKLGVMPSVRPTVPKADVHSYNASLRLTESNAATINVPMLTKKMPNTNTDRASTTNL